MITSFSNAGIKAVSALIAKHKERKATGLFTAEGKKIFLEAPKELIRDVYISESFEKGQPDLPEDIPYTVVKDEVFARMCDTKTPQGILTVFQQPAYSLEEMLHNGKRLFVLLENVQDPGNAGTILRTAEGVGAAGVILSRDSADLFSPKTIRSTMGSVFRVPFLYAEDLCSIAKELKKAGVKTCAAHLAGNEPFDQADYGERTALFIGNEGKGLTGQLTAEADLLVRIPMEGKLESLNASVAAGILMYEVYRKDRSIK